MPEMYYEPWRCCVDLVRHMWRFYCLHRDADASEMKPAARRSWTACKAVWDSMTQSEREIMRVCHTQSVSSGGHMAAAERYAAQHRVRVEDVMTVVFRCYKQTALIRGIADAGDQE